MESLADFRKKLQDATLDARSKDQSLSTSIALLTSTHERLLASHSSLLKERDVLVSKVADGERHLLSITRECDARVASVKDERDQVAKQLAEQKAACEQLSTALTASKDELARVQVTAALAAADAQATTGSVKTLETHLGPEKAITQQAVEAFMAELRSGNEVSVMLAKETAAAAESLAAKVTQLEAEHAATKAEAATAMSHVQTMSSLVLDLRLALESSRVKCTIAETARAAAEDVAKEAQAAQATAQASLQAKAQLIDSLQTQLASAGDAHVRHTEMLGQATSALRTQDTALQKLRAELLALHDTVDKHDAAMRAMQAVHAQDLEAKESQLQGLEQQLAMLKVELDRTHAEAGSATKASEASITALQAELVNARQDCILARQEVMQAEERSNAATTSMKAAVLAQQDAEKHARAAQAALQAVLSRMPASGLGDAFALVPLDPSIPMPTAAPMQGQAGLDSARSIASLHGRDTLLQLVPPPHPSASRPPVLPSYNSTSVGQDTVPVSVPLEGEDKDEVKDKDKDKDKDKGPAAQGEHVAVKAAEEDVQAEFTPPSSPVRPSVRTSVGASGAGGEAAHIGVGALPDSFHSAVAIQDGKGGDGRFTSAGGSGAFPEAVSLPIAPATARVPAPLTVAVPAQPVTPLLDAGDSQLAARLGLKVPYAPAPAVADIKDSRDTEGVWHDQARAGGGAGGDTSTGEGAQGPRKIVDMLQDEDEEAEDVVTATAVLNALINAGRQQAFARSQSGASTATGRASLPKSGTAGRIPGGTSAASAASGKRKRPVSPQQPSLSP